MFGEQRRKGFLSTWHNFHLPSAWLTVTTKPRLGQKTSSLDIIGGMQAWEG